jgi:hypothetical protein
LPATGPAATATQQAAATATQAAAASATQQAFATQVSARATQVAGSSLLAQLLEQNFQSAQAAPGAAGAAGAIAAAASASQRNLARAPAPPISIPQQGSIPVSVPAIAPPNTGDAGLK